MGLHRLPAFPLHYQPHLLPLSCQAATLNLRVSVSTAPRLISATTTKACVPSPRSVEAGGSAETPRPPYRRPPPQLPPLHRRPFPTLTYLRPPPQLSLTLRLLLKRRLMLNVELLTKRRSLLKRRLMLNVELLTKRRSLLKRRLM